jgi:hypothetical protein
MTENPAIVAALIAASAALGAGFFAFVAALIGAAVARRNAVLSAQIAQRTKRAEFRQAWINQLRDSIAKAHVAFISSKPSREGTESAIRMLLMVNRKDPDFERLRKTVQKLSNKANEKPEDIDKAQADFIIVSQDILKREWEVVKREINKFDEDARRI